MPWAGRPVLSQVLVRSARVLPKLGHVRARSACFWDRFEGAALWVWLVLPMVRVRNRSKNVMKAVKSEHLFWGMDHIFTKILTNIWKMQDFATSQLPGSSRNVVKTIKEAYVAGTTLQVCSQALKRT